MKNWKTLICASVIVLILVAAASAAFRYTASDNRSPQLSATDDTAFQTVAANTQSLTPTKEHPVRILAQVERLYGLHLGTPVKIRYQVAWRDKADVRFDTLMRGVLSRYASTWRLWQPPTIVKTWHSPDVQAGGITTCVIEVVVAVWEPPAVAANASSKKLAADDLTPPDGSPTATPTPDHLPNGHVIYPGTPVNVGSSASSPESAAASNAHTGPVNAAALPADTAPTPAPPTATPAPTPEDRELWPFSVEFLYATGHTASGETKWSYIATPAIHFGFASLVEPKANKLDFGSLDDIPSHNNPIGIAAIFAGALSTLAGLGYFGALVVELRRRRNKPIEPPAEVKRYRQDLLDAESIRRLQGQSYLARKRIAVRTFFGDATLSDLALSDLWRHHPQYDRIVYMLSILREAVAPGRLNSFEEREVDKVMEQLIAEKLADNQEKPKVRSSRLQLLWQPIARSLPLRRRR